MNNTPPEVIAKWRQEFEALKGVSPVWAGTRYANIDDHREFSGFVLGRQSVCIDLPKVYSVDYHVIEGVRKSIEAQGYTVS